MTPALTSSSLNLCISVRISAVGSFPASDSLLAGTKTMNRIGFSPCGWADSFGAPTSRRTDGPEIDTRSRDCASLLAPRDQASDAGPLDGADVRERAPAGPHGGCVAACRRGARVEGVVGARA